jgi:hypothetical protein
MPTCEIPRDQWSSALDSFSRRHDGWLATLEVSSGHSAPHDEAVDKPLIGIVTERGARGESTISILLGGTPRDHVAHVVRAPTRVRLVQTEEGADEALQIDSEDGATTRLRFRVAALPEAVDGIAMGAP